MATKKTYVIHPARLQVWGGNCAIFEVSLGSFLINQRWHHASAPGRVTRPAQRQRVGTGTAMAGTVTTEGRGVTTEGSSDNRGQRWPGQ